MVYLPWGAPFGVMCDLKETLVPYGYGRDEGSGLDDMTDTVLH